MTSIPVDLGIWVAPGLGLEAARTRACDLQQQRSRWDDEPFEDECWVFGAGCRPSLDRRDGIDVQWTEGGKNFKFPVNVTISAT